MFAIALGLAVLVMPAPAAALKFVKVQLPSSEDLSRTYESAKQHAEKTRRALYPHVVAAEVELVQIKGLMYPGGDTVSA